MTKLDADYYRARLDAERTAAVTATTEEARAAHLELAEHYSGLLAATQAANDDGPNCAPPDAGLAPPEQT